MPRLSDTMEEGVLSRWLKKPGDTIAKGDILAEIETDKATMDLESFESGVLEQLLVAEGTTVPIGQAVAVVGDGSGVTESIPGAGAPAATDDSTGPEQEAALSEAAPGGEETGGQETGGASNEPIEVKSEPAEPAGADQTAPDEAARASDAAEEHSAPTSPAGRIVTSPLARKLAKEGGIDLANVAGTGPGGRIVRADVEDAIAGSPGTGSPGTGTGEPEARSVAPKAHGEVRRRAEATERPKDERVVLSNIRKITARRLTESQAVPHFFLTNQVNAKRLLKVRADINEQLAPEGVKISVTDLIVRASALALRAHPEVNASFDTDAVIRHGRVSVGIAVALDDGLIVPVIHDADQKTVSEISVETISLATRARAGKLKLDEFTGGTFSVSNLGMFGIDQFTAVINPPEAGILAVGAASDHLVKKGKKLVNVPMFSITMTADHRVLDGATAAAFLRELTELLQNPMRLIV